MPVGPDLFSLQSYSYDLPPELIAQEPCSPRDASRLLIIDRKSHSFHEAQFSDLKTLLNSQDCLVCNNTKVIPARLMGRRPTGGVVEMLMLRQWDAKRWEALVRPARKLKLGEQILIDEDTEAVVVEVLPEGRRLLEFRGPHSVEALLDHKGTIPLPHYIKGGVADAKDKVDYQTVYAQVSGSSAAPTAGLHFTPQLLDSLKERGVEKVAVTLHTGVGTFRPVQVEDIRQHVMHVESFEITEASARQITEAKTGGKRLICVGTTSCRALETASQGVEGMRAGSFDTGLFVYPGFKFQVTDSLITNFHLPGSSLLMLVSAFAGYELTMEAYRYAVEKRFRFFSYGDAMWIV